MQNRRAFVATSLATGAISACGVLTPRHTARFKIELGVTIAGAAHTESTVFEMTWIDVGPMAGLDVPGRWDGRGTGDAITIDLGPKGNIFALWNNVPLVESQLFPADGLLFSLLQADQVDPKKIESGEVYELLKNVRTHRRISEKSWPALLHFENPTDLQSARVAEPTRMSELLGTESHIDYVSLEGVDAPITRGIERRIPAWEQIGKRAYAGPITQSTIWTALKKSNFALDGEKL